jgi:hypothetical protein
VLQFSLFSLHVVSFRVVFLLENIWEGTFLFGTGINLTIDDKICAEYFNELLAKQKQRTKQRSLKGRKSEVYNAE